MMAGFYLGLLAWMAVTEPIYAVLFALRCEDSFGWRVDQITSERWPYR